MNNKQKSPILSWKERQKQELRKELLKVAQNLFERNGFLTPSVDEIAKTAGIAKGTFYLYFKTKADILYAILDESLNEMEQSVHGIEDSLNVDTAGQSLRRLIRCQLDYFEHHHSMVALLFNRRGLMNTWLHEDERIQLVDRFKAITTERYAKILDAGRQSGEYKIIDPSISAHVLYGILYGLIWNAIDNAISFTEIEETAMLHFERGVKHLE